MLSYRNQRNSLVKIVYHFLYAFVKDEIYSKVCKLAESFPGFDDINVCAPLLKYTLQSRLSWWKRECMDKVYPTRFHFFAGFMNVYLIFLVDAFLKLDQVN